MMARKYNVWLAAAAVGAIQTAFLAWMVWDRVSLLKHGREIVAEVVPLDPRDLFRGDYVILGYTFTGTGESSIPEGKKAGDVVYATLLPEGDAKWQLVQVTGGYPAVVDKGNVVLKARVAEVWSRREGQPSTGRLRYGIESYFVPEGTGRELEQLVRDRKIEAVLAVGEGGDVAIKGLTVDGRRVHEEPLL